MPRPRKSEPTYHKHRTSGLGFILFPGDPRPKYLGPYGSEASLNEFRREVAEWRSQQKARAPSSAAIPLDLRAQTVEDLIAFFWTHIEHHYRKPDGTATSEVDGYRQSLRPLRHLYGHTRTVDFGPIALEAVQKSMIEGSWMTEEETRKGKRRGRTGWSRKMVNQRIGRIVRMFKWGVRKQLVPVHVYEALRTVPGLQAGRSEARELADVAPAPLGSIEAVLKVVGPVVKAMIRVQQFTGLRPGEVCGMRPRDLDRDGLAVGKTAIWVYRPKDHKGAWRGQKKAVPIGPRAQEVILPFLERAADAFLFSPAEEIEAIRQEAEARSAYPSRRGKNRVAAPRRRPGARYSVAGYGRRIRMVCKRHKIVPFTPHAIRHLVATEVQAAFGLDAARAVLDHKDAQVTMIYAARDLRQAAEVAAKIG